MPLPPLHPALNLDRHTLPSPILLMCALAHEAPAGHVLVSTCHVLADSVDAAVDILSTETLPALVGRPGLPAPLGPLCDVLITRPAYLLDAVSRCGYRLPRSVVSTSCDPMTHAAWRALVGAGTRPGADDRGAPMPQHFALARPESRTRIGGSLTVEYAWDVRATRTAVDGAQCYGYWDRPFGEEGGGLWFGRADDGSMCLSDYDGAGVLPSVVCHELSQWGIIVPPECWPTGVVPAEFA